MKLLHLFIAAVLVAGIGYFVYNNNENSFKGTNKDELSEVLPSLDLSKVKKIRIQTSDDSVTLAETESGWAVSERGNFQADFEKVTEFARTFDELKALTKEEVGKSQFARLKLLSPSNENKDGTGTQVTFLDASGGEVAAIRIGKSSELANDTANNNDPMNMMGGGGNSAGKFVGLVKADGDPESVFMVSEAFANLDSKPSSWLDKQDFFKVSKPAKISVTSTNAEVNWTLSRATENDSWTLSDLKDDEKMSTTAANVFNSYLSFPSFNDVSTDSEGLKDASVIKVTTFDGFDYTLKVGGKTEDGYYPMGLEVNGSFPTERTPDEGESEEDKKTRDEAFAAELKSRQDKLANEKKLEGSIFLVNTWTVDSGLKVRSEFLEAETEEANPIPIDPSAVDQNGVPSLLQRPEGSGISIPDPESSKTAEEVIQDALKNVVDPIKNGEIKLPVNGEELKEVSEERQEAVEQELKNIQEKLNNELQNNTENVEKAVEEIKTATEEVKESVQEAVEKVEDEAEKAKPAEKNFTNEAVKEVLDDASEETTNKEESTESDEANTGGE